MTYSTQKIRKKRIATKPDLNAFSQRYFYPSIFSLAESPSSTVDEVEEEINDNSPLSEVNSNTLESWQGSYSGSDKTKQPPDPLIDENDINNKRMLHIKNTFTSKLLKCIREEHFEYGYTSMSEIIAKEQYSLNSFVTNTWLSQIFVENFKDTQIIIGVLRIISTFTEEQASPHGISLALAALSHNDMEVKESGIRVLENWGSKQSLITLQNVQEQPGWLGAYLKQVIEDLKSEICPS
ncbi:hypothetical protein [Larkinella sp.]|uniref:hypothetical protein n=1 Tax=Larkinella sp. TaxID=2034517 RepID=UPI003BAC4E66